MTLPGGLVDVASAALHGISSPADAWELRSLHVPSAQLRHLSPAVAKSLLLPEAAPGETDGVQFPALRFTQRRSRRHRYTTLPSDKLLTQVVKNPGVSHTSLVPRAAQGFPAPGPSSRSVQRWSILN